MSDKEVFKYHGYREQYINDILEEREHQNQLQQNREELMKIFGNL